MSLRNRMQTDPLDVVISWNLKEWASTYKISDSNRDRLMERVSVVSKARAKHISRFHVLRGILQDLCHVLAYPGQAARELHGHVDYRKRLIESPQLLYSSADGHAVFHPFIGGSGIFYVIIPGLPG
jgi:hypothetical protein